MAIAWVDFEEYLLTKERVFHQPLVSQLRSSWKRFARRVERDAQCLHIMSHSLKVYRLKREMADRWWRNVARSVVDNIFSALSNELRLLEDIRETMVERPVQPEHPSSDSDSDTDSLPDSESDISSESD